MKFYGNLARRRENTAPEKGSDQVRELVQN